MRHGLRLAGGAWTWNTPVVKNYLQQFYDNRRGFGAGVTAGLDPATVTLLVTNSNDSGAGSLRAACAVTGPTTIRFDPTVGDIHVPSHGSIPLTSNTLLDGHGWPGLIYGSIDASNTSNIIVMFLSATQPFAYGKNVSGPCMNASNSPMAYYYHCTAWDSGDILFASGAYWLSPNGVNDLPGPYYFTVDSCRFGPNPGEYAMMSPILGSHPGFAPGALNGINNDARNGKCMNCAYDHNAVASGAPLSNFDHFAYGTMVNNVMQGCLIRNGKGRSETIDVASNLVAKYGTPYGLGGPSINFGAGSSCDDNGTVNIEGNVYIPYYLGEQFVGFQNPVADRNGVAHIIVTDPSGNKAVNAEGTAPKVGNARISGNYVVGQTVVPSKFSTGFDRTAYYALTVPDVSTYSAALALVTKLEDEPATRAGNPFCATQPPGWRDVHTDPTFPPPNTPPPVQRALFGAYMATHPGESYAQANTRGDTAMGPLQVIRVYDGAAGAAAVKTAASNMGVLGVRPCILSFKFMSGSTNDVVGVAAGTYDTELTGFFTGLPASVYWSYEHEMDAKIQQGKYTVAQWQAAWRHIYNLSKTTNSKAQATPIWTGFNFTVASAKFPGGRFAAVYPGDAYVDVIGVDPYTTTSGQTASQLINPLLTAVASTGKPLGVGETGTDYATPSATATAAFASSWSAVASKLEFVSWFNGTGPGIRDSTQTIVFEIDGVSAAASAWQAVVTG